MSGKLKNKQLPVSCRMFLRFLKEANLFKEWTYEAEMRVIKDNEIKNSPIETSVVKFTSFSEKWLWYVKKGKLNRYVSQCPISNIIDYTMTWSSTRRGHDFWSKANSNWKELFYRYHTERATQCERAGFDISDDFSVFAKLLMDFLQKKPWYGPSPVHRITLDF